MTKNDKSYSRTDEAKNVSNYLLACRLTKGACASPITY